MAADVDGSAPSSPLTRDPSTLPLTHVHITDALCRSPDHGATLIFSRLNISDINAAAIHTLTSIGENGTGNERAIERLAIAHNRLSSLPAEFAHLTHLRYINLKHNQFAAFPDILTTMPSLEILDLSHNRISRLPLQAGQLVNLKVLCLSRNQLASIPSYIIQFDKLEVLQIDRNPLEWPPTFVTHVGQSNESGQGMREWIQSLKKWIESNSKAHSDDEPSYFNLGQEARWRYPTKAKEGDTLPHTRSCSIDSSLSFSSIPESISDLPTAKVGDFRPPSLHLGILRPYGDEPSPTKSFDSLTNSPAELEPFDELSFMVSSPKHHFDAPVQHNRNASYAGQERHSHRTEVLTKMSMPDLRSAKLDFSMKVPELPQRVYQESLSNEKPPSSQPRRFAQHQLSSSVDSEVRVLEGFDDRYEDGSTSRATFSMASERNSYFRRLSAFPASGALPHPLLCLVDSARSMLFAACQVYQTLGHYTVHVVDERLSSVLRKVLEPASSDMLHLITSLERFDAWSRKMLPPPAICRAVVESCRDTAAAFNKVVRALTLQVQVLAACDDVRYSRLLLVELFAATAEIACAWRNMVPEIPHLKSILRTNRLVGQVITANPETKLVSIPMPRHQANGPGSYSISASVSRARTVRRNAGSFSSKDVEIGKQLPSYDDAAYGSSFPLPTPGRLQPLRTPRRQTTTPAALPSTQDNSHIFLDPTSVTPPMPRGTETFDQNHSRQNSRSSVQQTSPVSLSPSIPNKVPAFLELPSSSKLQVDKEAIQAVKEAVDIAPTVWDMIEAHLGDILHTRIDVRNMLNTARLVTKRLADVIIAPHENDSLDEKKLLREDARLFLKAVVQLTNAIKSHKEVQSVPLTLRTNIVKLTNATEEFAILLHVSSFSPSTSSTPKPLSPVISSTHMKQHRDNQLKSSLSRSKRAWSPLSIKVNETKYYDGPQSALPIGSPPLKISIVKRNKGKD